MSAEASLALWLGLDSHYIWERRFSKAGMVMQNWTILQVHFVIGVVTRVACLSFLPNYDSYILLIHPLVAEM